MRKFPLQKPRDKRSVLFSVKESPPFVENKCGMLIHRPRSIEVYRLHGYSHIAVTYYCGMTGLNSHEKNKLTFLDYLDDSAIVCHVCERRCIDLGMPSSSEIAGKHVHIGGLKPVKYCGCK